MKNPELVIGLRVKTLRAWAGVEVNTKGTIVELYDGGYRHACCMIEWDNLNGLRDGFSPSEQGYLEEI